MTEIICPTCKTDEHLHGTPKGDLIELRCDACGTRWERDPSPQCPHCGRKDLEAAPQAAWEKSRGTQLSIAYITVVHLCPACDADLVRQQRQTNIPLPPRDNPAG